MAVSYSFADRFSYPSANGVSPDIDATTAKTLSDAELEAISPELAEVADMVRGGSVLLKRTPTIEIFKIVTTKTDPRIALTIAAAKRKSNNLALFHGLEEVQQVMFNDSARSPNTNETLNTSLFSDGIRQVTAALCVAILLGKIPDVQQEYALKIEENAIADLERICATYELSDSLQPATDKAGQSAPVAFYFQPLDFELAVDEELAVEWYSPSFTTTWVPVQTYTGSMSTWNVVSDLADAINIYTAQNIDSALLAVAELSGPIVNSKYLHTLCFYPRKPVNGVLGHSINVKIEVRPITLDQDSPLVFGGTTADPAGSLRTNTPFKWGPHSLSIKDYPINGSIIVTYFDKASSLTLNELNESYVPTVLYFRNKAKYITDGVTPKSSLKIKYRLQPWQPNIAATNNQPLLLEQDFNRLTDGDPGVQLTLDNSRYSQIAVELLNGLAEINLQTKASGCIIRNDPVTEGQPLSGLELVAWGLSKILTHIVLDILEIPEDIEMATGNLMGPRTSFSSNPRTVRVSVRNESFLGSLASESNAMNEGVQMVPKQQARVWQSILDEAATVEDMRWY